MDAIPYDYTTPFTFLIPSDTPGGNRVFAFLGPYLLQFIAHERRTARGISETARSVRRAARWKPPCNGWWAAAARGRRRVMSLLAMLQQGRQPCGRGILWIGAQRVQQGLAVRSL
jgi:hypothetical protein